MGKHKQSSRLGNVSDFSSRKSITDPYERIAALEKRVSTLESLLSDVMLQLDTSLDNPDKKSKKKKPEKKVSGPKQHSENNRKQQEQSLKVATANAEKIHEILTNGEKKTLEEIKFELGLGSKTVRKALDASNLIVGDGNRNSREKLYSLREVTQPCQTSDSDSVFAQTDSGKTDL